MAHPFSDVNKPFESLNGNGKDSAGALAAVSEGGTLELEVMADMEDLKERDSMMCFYCRKGDILWQGALC